MLIDWFTVAAQAVNFIILIWLLKRYLYQPILNAIDDREQRIANELDDATAKQEEATNERDSFQQKNKQFDQERDSLLQQAKNDADVKRDQLLAQAQQDVDALGIKHQQTMARDAQNLKEMLSRKTIDEVFAITRKALTDITTVSLEQQAIEVFIQRLSELESSAKTALAKALKTTTEAVLLTSAFELSEPTRAAIGKAIKQTFDADIDLTFIISTDLISGIELSTNGQKLGWNIDDYLQSLEQDVVELLQKNKKPMNKKASVNKGQVKDKAPVTDSVAKAVIGPVTKVETLDE